MTIKLGDYVKFKTGLYPDEEGAIYRVLEVNQDRAIIEFVSTKMTILPQSVANLSELVEIEYDPTSASDSDATS